VILRRITPLLVGRDSFEPLDGALWLDRVSPYQKEINEQEQKILGIRIHSLLRPPGVDIKGVSLPHSRVDVEAKRGKDGKRKDSSYG